MNKAFFQSILFIGVFGVSWFLLSQLKWTEILKIQEKKNNTEQILGDLIWKEISRTEKATSSKILKNAIDDLVHKLCSANKIDTNKLKIHVLENTAVNAFALPNNHLVIYTGLIHEVDKQEELIGVLGHELAHLTEKHIMKKIVNEVGMTLIVSITSGSSTENISGITKLLTNAAFDRGLEKEADLKAVDYLNKAKVNPKPFADFLYKIALTNTSNEKYLEWMSTHPSSEDRVKYILDYIDAANTVDYEQLISDTAWKNLKNQIPTPSTL